MASPRSPYPLDKALAALEKQYGAPSKPVPRTPLQWILWENVAYLVDDAKRLRAFETLRKTVGLTAEALEAASREALLAVTRLGGMHPEARVDKLKDIAAIAREHGGKGLESVLELSPAAARKVLGLFPGIGKPGADKILMACGVATELALESNGLRVLLRLGYGKAAGSYAASYRSVQSAIADQRRAESGWALRAHLLLRLHGKRVCKQNAPDCDACPLAKGCPASS